MEKLELKHLAPYLPYKIKGRFQVKDVNEKAPVEIRNKLLRTDNVDFFLRYCKPILRPLSDLTKEELLHQGFWHHIDYLTHELIHHLKNDKDAILKCPYTHIQYLFEHHYDVFSLIPEGLAIDINTLEQ